MDNKTTSELHVEIQNLYKRINTIEEAIKILTELRVSDAELKKQIYYLEERVKERERMLIFLISPVYVSIVGFLFYILIQ